MHHRLSHTVQATTAHTFLLRVSAQTRPSCTLTRTLEWLSLPDPQGALPQTEQACLFRSLHPEVSQPSRFWWLCCLIYAAALSSLHGQTFCSICLKYRATDRILNWCSTSFSSVVLRATLQSFKLDANDLFSLFTSSSSTPISWYCVVTTGGKSTPSTALQMLKGSSNFQQTGLQMDCHDMHSVFHYKLSRLVRIPRTVSTGSLNSWVPLTSWACTGLTCNLLLLPFWQPWVSSLSEKLHFFLLESIL